MLKPYRISLREEAGDTDLTLMFYCWAEDDDHADEQACDAYPGCELIITSELNTERDAAEISMALGSLPA